jgi:hypothetical protein
MMAQTRNVIINFITKLQERGLQRMQRQTYGLNNSFKSLQKSMRRFVGLTAIFALLRKSIRDFTEEAAEVKRLEIALNNLNLGFQSLAVEEYIKNLTRLSGVSDDLLRPAFGRIVRELKNVEASQALLNVAVDVARGTGQDLGTVTKALTRAFNGETTALKRLQIGISRSAIEGKDFTVILTELEKLYGNAGAAYLDSYAGKMDLLRVRLEEATEALGKGLIDGLIALGEGDVQSGLDKVVSAAEAIGRAFELAGKGLNFLAKSQSLTARVLGFEGGGFFGFSAKQNEDEAARKRSRLKAEEFLAELRRQKILDKLAKEAAARAAAAERKKKAEKAAADAADALKKRLESKFDIDNINLAAAAQKNLSEADRARVEALQALKTEGVKDDEAALNKLIDLEKKREAELQRQSAQSIALSAVVKNQRLADLQAELDALIALSSARAASISGSPIAPSITSAPLQIEAGIPTNIADAFMALSLAGVAEQQGSAALMAAEAVAQQITVIQNIAGNVTTERELFDTYVDAIFQINRQGTNSQLVNLGR